MHIPSCRIDLQLMPTQYEGMPLLPVSPNSPIMLRKQVQEFAFYFQREFDYDFVQYLAKEKTSYSAYLIANQDFYRPRMWVGACCFRERSSGNALQWIWIHPFWRNRGILKASWPALREHHGNFAVEGPLSPAMESFLLKYNKCSQSWANNCHFDKQ